VKQMLPLDPVERRVMGWAGLGGLVGCVVGVVINDAVLAGMTGLWAGAWIAPWALARGDRDD
jgi:hypothetical protein